VSIVATYCVFNEADLIAESIRSVKAFVDRFVVIDAAFTTNPVEATHSTDNTRETVENAADPLPVLYCESDRKLNLDHARNMSFRFVDPGDWALVIDGDEVLLGEWNELRELFGEIRRRKISEPVGLNVYTACVKFDGHAPAIGEDEYKRLPIIHTRGVQARLLPADDVQWKRTPTRRGTYGMYRDGELVKGCVDPRAVIVNQRIRQSYEHYQLDYVRESADTPR
jgi:glycosyltransferase involved in cell wall biosynthesis